MKQQPSRNAVQARYLRKNNKDGGNDEEEQDEDNHFKQNFEKALKNHSKKATIKGVEEQIEYFGYKMEAFNMKEEEQMGQIDQENFFVFGNKRRFNDAWVDNLNDEDEEAVDNMRKKIKLEQRQKTVFQAQKKLNDNFQSDEEDNSDGLVRVEEQDEQIVDENKLKPKEIKLLLVQLLPYGMNANKYTKKLKKQKQNELYDKIIFLCNQYISATGEHEILTIKKQDLQEQLDEGLSNYDEPINNWNHQSSNEKSKEIKEIRQKNEEEPQDEDNIF